MKFIARLLLLVPLSLFGASSLGAETVEDQSRIDSLEAEISSIESEHGPFHILLFNPLMDIAFAELNRGYIESAIDHFQRAQNISHRNEGVYSPKQLEIVRQLTNIALVEGEFKHADQQQRFSFFIERHHLEEDDPLLHAAYDSMADWYMLTGQPRRARRLLEESLALTEQTGAAKLPIATRINKTRRLEGICCRAKILKQAIADAEGKADTDTIIAAYMELGDSYILTGRENDATVYYQKAFALSPISSTTEAQPISIKKKIPDPRIARGKTYKLERDIYSNRYEAKRVFERDLLADEELPPQWFILDADEEQIGFANPDIRTSEDPYTDAEQLVGYPILFQQSQLDNLLPGRFRKSTDGLVIELAFDVMADGNLEDIEVVSSNAPNKLNRLVMDALRKVYFRPATRNGVPIVTEGYRFTQNFNSFVREV